MPKNPSKKKNIYFLVKIFKNRFKMKKWENFWLEFVLLWFSSDFSTFNSKIIFVACPGTFFTKMWCFAIFRHENCRDFFLLSGFFALVFSVQKVWKICSFWIFFFFFLEIQDFVNFSIHIPAFSLKNQHFQWNLISKMDSLAHFYYKNENNYTFLYTLYRTTSFLSCLCISLLM